MPSWKINFRKEINEIYAHTFLFKLAEGVAGIFIPLYILQQGLGISTVLGFFLVYYITHIFLPLPFGFVSSRFGYKKTSLVSSLLIILFYLSLRSAATSLEFYIAALIGGIGFIMYWMGMNPEMAVGSDEGKEESEVGFFFSLPSIASMVAPATGGILLYFSGFSLLFLVAGSLMFVSFTPFLFSPEHSEGLKTDIGDVFSFSMLEDFLTFYFKGFLYFLEKVYWPLYLAIILGVSLDIGAAGTVFSLGAAVVSVVSGKMMNPGNKKNFLFTSAVLVAITAGLMGLVSSTSGALVVAGLFGMFFTALSTSIYSSAIKRAEETDIIEYFAFREISLACGRISALLAAFFIFISLGENFVAVFILAGFASLLTAVAGNKIIE